MRDNEPNEHIIACQEVPFLQDGSIALTGQEARAGMHLHKRSISELITMPIDERRQALIEWKLKRDPVSLVPDQQGHLVPLWQFLESQPREERAKTVRKYEAHLYTWSGNPAITAEKIKRLVLERRRILEEAFRGHSNQTLEEILANPGFQRYNQKALGEPVLTQNHQTLSLLDQERSFPLAMLYSLFVNPPDFMKQSKIEPVLPNSLTPREAQFVCWLWDAQKEEGGWLTLARINELNTLVSPSRKVFHPKNGHWVELEAVRQLIAQLRKNPTYKKAIETFPRVGKAWRLNN